MVKFKPSIPEAGPGRRPRAARRQGRQRDRRLDVKVVRVGKGNAERKIRSISRIRTLSTPRRSASPIPSCSTTASLSKQWALHNSGQDGGKDDADIDVPSAWDVTRGASNPSAKTTVAIIDTGVNKNHPDLKDKVTAERNWATTDQSLDDVYGHGTHVAGIAAAVTDTPSTTTTSPASLARPNCKIINGKVCFDDGGCLYDRIANGVLWAVGCHIRVGNTCQSPVQANTINISLTVGFNSRTLQDAIDKAWSRGAVISCAAGNEGTATWSSCR